MKSQKQYIEQIEEEAREMRNTINEYSIKFFKEFQPRNILETLHQSLEEINTKVKLARSSLKEQEEDYNEWTYRI